MSSLPLSTSQIRSFLLLLTFLSLTKPTISAKRAIPSKITRTNNFPNPNKLTNSPPQINRAALFNLDLDFISSPNDFSAQVNGCKIYDSNSNCLFCIRDQYLSNGVCVNIAYSQTIHNCNINLNLTNCYQCDAGYAVNSAGTACVNIGIVNNCASYFGLGVCASCVSGSFLTAGLCSVPLSNCLTAASNTACLACQTNYYLTATSTCLQVTSLISNCLTYSSTQLCTLCLTGYALSTDGLICIASSAVSGQLDPNCQQSIISTGSYCNICRQGYYLTNSNTCTTLNASDESCFIANPLSPAKCLVCMKGYTIQSNNLCVVNSQASQAQIGTNPVASSSLLRAAVSLVLVVLLLN